MSEPGATTNAQAAEAAAAAAAATAATDVQGTGRGTGLEDPTDYDFWYKIVRTPCFRETALYSMGAGVALGALQFHRTRDATNSADMAMKMGCGVALFHWVVCRKRYYDSREYMYGTLQGAQRKGEAAAAKATAAAAARRRAQQESNEAGVSIESSKE